MPIAISHSVSHGPLRAARTLIAMSLLVGVLSGCAIWPKALTWGSDDAEPETASPAAPHSAPAGPVIAPPMAAEEPKPPLPAPVPRSIADTVPLAPQPQPAMKVAPQTAPAAEAATAKAPAKGKGRGKGKASMPAAADMVKGFYLNIGLFAVASNGTNAFRTLEQAEMPVFTDVVKSKRGPLTRVRVGPYLTKAQADAAAEKIKGMKLDAVVFQN